MSGKKPSPPELEIDFLETGHEDRYMQEVFDHIDKVPDKEPCLLYTSDAADDP